MMPEIIEKDKKIINAGIVLKLQRVGKNLIIERIF
jgi:hypothetical protein